MISALNGLVLVIAVVGLIAMAIGVAKLREGNQDRITTLTLGLCYLWLTWFLVVAALNTMSDWSTTMARIDEFSSGAYEIESVWPFILGTSPFHILLMGVSMACVGRTNATLRLKYLGLGLAVLLVICMTVFAILSIWVALN